MKNTRIYHTQIHSRNHQTAVRRPETDRQWRRQRRRDTEKERE